MSERRRLESTIYDAASDLEAAAAKLDEARDYLSWKNHDFLRDANPLLDRILRVDEVEIRSKANDLRMLEVRS